MVPEQEGHWRKAQYSHQKADCRTWTILQGLDERDVIVVAEQGEMKGGKDHYVYVSDCLKQNQSIDPNGRRDKRTRDGSRMKWR